MQLPNLAVTPFKRHSHRDKPRRVAYHERDLDAPVWNSWSLWITNPTQTEVETLANHTVGVTSATFLNFYVEKRDSTDLGGPRILTTIIRDTLSPSDETEDWTKNKADSVFLIDLPIDHTDVDVSDELVITGVTLTVPISHDPKVVYILRCFIYTNTPVTRKYWLDRFPRGTVKKTAIDLYGYIEAEGGYRNVIRRGDPPCHNPVPLQECFRSMFAMQNPAYFAIEFPYQYLTYWQEVMTVFWHHYKCNDC